MLEFHDDTTLLLAQLKEELPQGIILKGQVGVGLLTLARSIAGKQLINIVRPIDKDGTVMLDGTGEIRISQIRELATQTRGKSTTQQVIIIDDADKMGLPAQHAFLKLLEEPTASIHFILTAHNAHTLLPTILSRVQPIIVKPISRDQTLRLITAAGETDQRRTQQLLFLAEGRPAEIRRLLQDTTYFEQQVTTVEDARQFLSAATPKRIEIAQKYHNDRPGTLLMLQQALRIVHTTLKTRPDTKLVDSADKLATLYDRINLNGNIRLQLLNFVIQ